jgi:hypothetical protein
MARRKAASTRKGWRESWEVLRQQHGVMLPDLKDEDPWAWPDWGDRPAAGEKYSGLTVSKRAFEEVDLEGLWLVRTLFADCRFHGMSFRDTDLSMSCLNGCEFIDCDFTGASLIRVDLRKATLFACRFVGCELIGADLREAKLEHCTFTRAKLAGATIDRALKDALRLSAVQRDFQVDWREEGDRGPDHESGRMMMS